PLRSLNFQLMLGSAASFWTHKPNSRYIRIPFAVSARYVHSRPAGSSYNRNTLSDEQGDALARALRGENVFITGPAGSGKSHLLKRIVKQLAAQGRRFFLTGGTPLTAFDIGGAPLHSFTEGQTTKELARLQNRRRKDPASIEYRAKWQRLETIIIDDISQIDASLFDGLDQMARKMRSPKGPFAGIQIIASGDFFQLPPESNDANIPAPDYAFNAQQWEPTFSTNQIELSQIYSPSESEFATLLKETRTGKISTQSDKLLSSLARPISSPSVELCPLQVQTKALVSAHLESLPGDLAQFWARENIITSGNNVTYRKLENEKEAYEEIVPKVLGLKVLIVLYSRNMLPIISIQVGAQVICVQDIQIGAMHIPKHTLGTVTDFSTLSDASKSKVHNPEKGGQPGRRWPLVAFENGEKALVVPVQFKFGGPNETAQVESSRTQV
ncbi:unnamed protein product, partial [Rhizoctonia solani]